MLPRPRALLLVAAISGGGCSILFDPAPVPQSADAGADAAADSCGDGVLDAGEECDDGDSTDPADGCTSSCELRAQGPGGDGCADATLLDLVAIGEGVLAAHARGDTTERTDAFTSSCNPNAAQDEVYEMEVPGAGLLSITLQRGPASGRPLVHVRSALCGSSDREIACELPAGGSEATLEVSVEGGVYFVIADANQFTGATYDLTVLWTEAGETQ